MSAIKGKNTKPELLIRKALHARGFRYRLHSSSLPGKPDIVFPKHHAAVFVNGCFWHGHSCPLFKWPSTRQEFWHSKITGNKERDARVLDCLEEANWRVAVVWECAVKGRGRISIGEVVDSLEEWLSSDAKNLHLEGNFL